ncbi:hypothetical protein APT58_15150 [Corynebacterium glutamicum]|nr:hypothetical protein APT58_15150 [Corynebacterium glutamicum]
MSEKALWAFKLVIKFIDNRALIFMLCSIVFTIGVSIFPNATFNVFDVEIPWRYFWASSLFQLQFVELT